MSKTHHARELACLSLVREIHDTFPPIQTELKDVFVAIPYGDDLHSAVNNTFFGQDRAAKRFRIRRVWKTRSFHNGLVPPASRETPRSSSAIIRSLE